MDNWSAYQRHLKPDKYEIGKYTQKIERKNLIIGHNQAAYMQDLMLLKTGMGGISYRLGLLINKVEFGAIFIHDYRFNPLSLAEMKVS